MTIELTPAERAVFVRGVEHFNAHEFWEAHEAWEQLWLEAEGDDAEFYQGIIQLAAAYHHMKRGTLRGAVRLVDAAVRRLENFPPQYGDVDRSAAVESALRHRHWAASHDGVSLAPDEFPQLRMVNSRS